MPLRLARPSSVGADRTGGPTPYGSQPRLRADVGRAVGQALRLYRMARSAVERIVWRHPMSVAATLALVLLIGLIVMPVPAVSDSGVEPAPESSPPPPGAQTISQASPELAGPPAYTLMVDS